MPPESGGSIGCVCADDHSLRKACALLPCIYRARNSQLKLTPPLLLSGCCLPLRAYVVSGGLPKRPPGAERSALGAQMAEATTADPTKDSGLSWNSHTYVDSVPDSLVRDDNLPGANMDMRRKFEANCRRAQNVICEAIEELDGASFREDAWTRPGGGGGISRVLSNGNVFEKAGCSLSVVYGTMPQEALASATTRGADRAAGYAPGERVPFFACGLSSVMHPRNPMAPTMHFNYRYFETDGGVWWFGGGSDLTPSYLFEEDVKHFHGTYKAVCDKHDAEFYPRFKKWADEYFYIKHRGETRGLGGIFFDGAPASRTAPSIRPPAPFPWRPVLTPLSRAQTSTTATPRRSSRSRRSASTPSSPRTCRSWRSTRTTSTRRRRRSGSRCAAGATSSSTWCTTAAPSSGSRRAAASSRSSCRCPRRRDGSTRTSRRPARPRPTYSTPSRTRATGARGRERPRPRDELVRELWGGRL